MNDSEIVGKQFSDLSMEEMTFLTGASAQVEPYSTPIISMTVGIASFTLGAGWSVSAWANCGLHRK